MKFHRCLAVIALFLSVTAVQGATLVWDGGGGSADGRWSNPLNWSTNTIPTATDSVVFNAKSTSPCELDSPRTVAAFSMNAGYTGTFTMSADLTVNGTCTLRSGTFSGGSAR